MDSFNEQYPTSYFSAPSQTLDPTLFEGRNIRSWVRQGLLTLLYDFYAKRYRHADLWSHAWIAGSGVSYQWEAAREPGDLDVLIGVDYVGFRRANPEYSGLSDREISLQMNEEFRTELQPTTERWNDRYEVTFYVNPGATDIRTIHPYAAYDLKYDEWTVTPDPNASAPKVAEWENVALNDRAMAAQVSARFLQAKQDWDTTHSGPQRRNAEVRLLSAAQQGNALFDEIHQNRTLAFSSQGEGYNDFHNYRWQAAKRHGTLPMLRKLREHISDMNAKREQELYGSELPSADVLVRRAALQSARYSA
jgi:hypothetical protein